MKAGKIQKVAALDQVVQICYAHGANYNPSNAALKPTALTALLELAHEKIEAVHIAQTAYMVAVNARADSFEEIPKLLVRITRLASAMDIPKADLEDVKMIKRKLFQPKRKKASVTSASSDGERGPENRRSMLKLDRNSVMNTFHLMIAALEEIEEYKPHDIPFTIEGLKARLAELHALNFAGVQAGINLSNARIARDKVLDGVGGVIDVTTKVRNYIRAKFGYSSGEARLVRGV